MLGLQFTLTEVCFVRSVGYTKDPVSIVYP